MDTAWHARTTILGITGIVQVAWLGYFDNVCAMAAMAYDLCLAMATPGTHKRRRTDSEPIGPSAEIPRQGI